MTGCSIQVDLRNVRIDAEGVSWRWESAAPGTTHQGMPGFDHIGRRPKRLEGDAGHPSARLGKAFENHVVAAGDAEQLQSQFADQADRALGGRCVGEVDSERRVVWSTQQKVRPGPATDLGRAQNRGITQIQAKSDAQRLVHFSAGRPAHSRRPEQVGVGCVTDSPRHGHGAEPLVGLPIMVGISANQNVAGVPPLVQQFVGDRYRRLPAPVKVVRGRRDSDCARWPALGPTIDATPAWNGAVGTCRTVALIRMLGQLIMPVDQCGSGQLGDHLGSPLGATAPGLRDRVLDIRAKQLSEARRGGSHQFDDLRLAAQRDHSA